MVLKQYSQNKPRQQYRRQQDNPAKQASYEPNGEQTHVAFRPGKRLSAYALVLSLMLSFFTLPAAFALTATAVKWQSVSDYSPHSADSFSTIAPAVFDGAPGDMGTGFTDTSGMGGSAYSYQVSAVNVGRESSKSAKAFADPSGVPYVFNQNDWVVTDGLGRVPLNSTSRILLCHFITMTPQGTISASRQPDLKMWMGDWTWEKTRLWQILASPTRSKTSSQRLNISPQRRLFR